MKQITNRYKRYTTGEWAKHPRAYLKKLGNKKLRKLDIEADSLRYRKQSQYKKFKAEKFCPFCFANIFAQNLNKEIKQLGECQKCHALKWNNIKCPHCKSDNVWKRDEMYRCKQCGKFFTISEPLSK